MTLRLKYATIDSYLKNEMLGCKPSKPCIGAVCWKHNAEETHLMGKKTQIAGISILPNWCTGLKQLIKSQQECFVDIAKILFQNVYELE